MAKYEIKGDILEAQVEAHIATFLGWCAEFFPFKLNTIDEQEFGADKSYTPTYGGVIYLQFKKSNGLKIHTQDPIAQNPIAQNPIVQNRIVQNRIAQKPIVQNRIGVLEKIRLYRKNKFYPDKTILYFQLRRQAKNAVDLQHNILKKHHNPQKGQYAVYVAPLFLDKLRYEAALFPSINTNTRFVMEPFIFHKCSRYGVFPEIVFHVLRHHISIVPHVSVTTHKHYYAYSEKGENITWHSPEILEQIEPTNLAQFVDYFFNYCMENTFPLNELANNLREISREVGFNLEMYSNSDNPIHFLNAYGKWLYENYQIRQFVFLK